MAQFTETVYTPEMIQGNFNFPGVNSNLIYDPLTTAGTTGSWSRSPFPGNIVPLNRFDPVARKVLLEFQPYVSPNRPGSFNSGGPTSNLIADEFAKVFFDVRALRSSPLTREPQPELRAIASRSRVRGGTTLGAELLADVQREVLLAVRGLRLRPL